MRAHTEGKDEMGRRFATVIGVAAAGVMALGATALAGGEPVDSTPPDLQLSVKKKQSIGIDPECEIRCNKWAVEVKASCGDEACTVRANGKLTNVKGDKLIKPRHDVDLHLAPGETRTIRLVPTKSQRKPARKALAEGERVKAKVTVRATDAAGNEATAKRTIRLVKGSSPGEPSAAQTAAGGPVDSTPPDLQLSGPKKQNPFSGHRARELKGAPVVVKVSCGDEACSASAEGEVKNEVLRPGVWEGTLEPGETELAVLKLDHRTQRKARKALKRGMEVKAKVTVEASDAAGNQATAKRTIKLVKKDRG